MTDQPTAIVTAAGHGLGEGIARHLASRGYRLLLTSNGGGAEALARELGCLSLRGSVTDPAHLAAAAERAVSAWGRIDAVVNNTGHPAQGALLEIGDDAWYDGLDLLLLNVVRMARLVTPVMARQGGGAIVNISTYVAEQPDLTFPVSSCLRGALSAWVKLYADAHGRDGIRMNNVLPGAFANYAITPERLERIPLRRQGQMHELGRVVAFLLSPEAGYVTGQNIRVDGGLGRAL